MCANFADTVSMLLIGVFFSSPSICVGQKQILKIDETAKYELYIIDVSLDDSMEMFSEMMISKKPMKVSLDTTHCFLIDDASTIQTISKRWKGKLTNVMYDCWYDYFIYVVENGMVKDEIRVNEKCMQAVSYQGIFDIKNLALERDTLTEKIVEASIEFYSVEVGRKFIDELRSVGGYYVPHVGRWYDYDGSFDISLPAKRNFKKKDLNELREKIDKEYPNKDYTLSHRGTHGGYAYVDIDCAENFFHEFQLYPKSDKWTKNSLTPIIVFGKKSGRLKQLTQKYTR